MKNGINYTAIDHPNALSGISGGTRVAGILGDTIYGNYNLLSNAQAFTYNNGIYNLFNAPNAGSEGTQILGISDNIIYGTYIDINTDIHGFIYDGSDFTTIDAPNAGTRGAGTQIYGIAGGIIYGAYYDESGAGHGFITSLPEPSTYALFGIGAIGMLMVLRRKKESGQAF